MNFLRDDFPSDLYLLISRYGANEIANNIINQNIPIKGVIIYDIFPELKSIAKRIIKYRNNKALKNLNHFSLKNVVSLKDPINLIIGFSLAKTNASVLDDLEKVSNIDKIIIFDGASYLCRNGFVFPKSERIIMRDDYYDIMPQRNLSKEYYVENQCTFTQTRDWLNDEVSVKTFDCYIFGHNQGNPFPLYDVWNQMRVNNQYFEPELIKLSNEEIFVDCGAYIGDTLENFSERVDTFKKYYAFEPDSRRFNKLHSAIQKCKNKGNILHIQRGAWSKEAELSFSQDKGCGEITGDCLDVDRKSTISVDSIDNVVSDKDQVSFIKMDIEGSELEALIGASKTIVRCKPTLAICVYHKREDLITIPQFIKELYPDYKLYLRAYYPHLAELVLYALP